MNTLRNSILGCVLIVALVFGLISVGISRDIAIGGVKGQILMDESKLPLANAFVVLYPADAPGSTTPAETPAFDPWSIVRSEVTVRTNEKGEFKMSNIPIGWYSVDSYGKAHRKDDKQLLVEIKEGKATSVDLSLKPVTPYLTINTSQRVFLPNEKVTFQAIGFVITEKLHVTVNGVGADQLVADPSVYQSLITSRGINSDPKFEVLKTEFQVRGKDAEGVFESIYELPQQLPQGAYTLEIRSDDGKFVTKSLVLVTDLACVYKYSDNQINAFVTDLVTGAPVSGAKVQVVTAGKTIAEAVSDAQGLCKLPVTKVLGSQDMAVLATEGERLAVASFSKYGSEDNGQVLLYSDRPIYRPGDHVDLKGIARLRVSDQFATPENQPVTIEVKNYDGETLQQFKTTTNHFGTFSIGFDLPKEVAQNVWVSAKAAGIDGSTDILVSSYRKPEFSMTLKPISPAIVRGDTAKVKVKCEYFFGGPVAGTILNASVRLADLWEWEDEDLDTTEDYAGEGEYIAEISAVTDANGEAELTFPTGSIDWKKFAIADGQLQFQVTGEQGDNYFDSTTEIKVRQGQYSARIESNQYMVRPKEPIDFNIRIKDMTQDVPANAAGKVEIYRVTWTKDYEELKEVIETVPVKITNGLANISYTPDRGGNFQFEFVVNDKAGRKISAITYVWVDDNSYYGGDPDGQQLSIKLNKKRYNVGEKIRANVRTSKKIGSVWVTLEDSSVRQSKLVDLTKGSAIVEFEALSSSMPNGFISAQAVHERKFFQREQSFQVSINAHALKIEVKPSKKVLQPGEEVEWDVSARDYQGKPVIADVSLSVVDEAIYRLQEDTVDPLGSFYPARYSQVVTGYSFPEVYLDGGDKGEVKIDDSQIRRNFKDTAQWTASAITDSSGYVKIKTKLPDNITTWRATAIAVSQGSDFGKSKSSTIARKNLMIQAFPPSHWVSGDQAKIKVAITEGAGENQDVQVQLDAAGMNLNGSKVQTIKLAPNETKEMSWNVSANMVGINEVKVVAKSAKAEDGVILNIPTLAFGAELFERQSFTLNAETPESGLKVFREKDASQGSLRLTIAPSMLSSLLGSVDALIEYPYGCVEQTMSRFAPALSVQRALVSNGVTMSPERSEKLAEVSRQSIAKLQTMQHSDGGFGWWESDNSCSEMTALVLNGLREAKSLGVNVPSDLITRAIAWGEPNLKVVPVTGQMTYGDNLEDKAALAAAISQIQASTASDNFLARLPLDAKETEILIAIAKGRNLERSLEARRILCKTILLNENSLSKVDDYRVIQHLSESILLMLNSPEQICTNDQVRAAAQRLMARRKGNFWISTADTASVLRAIAQFSYLMNEGIGETIVTLDRGNKTDINLSTLPGQAYQLELDAKDLPEGKNMWQVSLKSGSSAYVSMDYVRTVNQSEQIPATSSPDGSVKMSFHRMVSENNADGTQSLVCSKTASTEFKSGDILRCKVTYNSATLRDYLMFNIPIPSGMRSVDDPSMGYWWYSGMEIFDNRVAAFVGSIYPLDQKETVVEFNLRAERPGTFKVLPAFVEPMYSPEKRMHSASTFVTIQP